MSNNIFEPVQIPEARPASQLQGGRYHRENWLYELEQALLSSSKSLPKKETYPTQFEDRDAGNDDPLKFSAFETDKERMGNDAVSPMPIQNGLEPLYQSMPLRQENSLCEATSSCSTTALFLSVNGLAERRANEVSPEALYPFPDKGSEMRSQEMQFQEKFANSHENIVSGVAPKEVIAIEKSISNPAKSIFAEGRQSIVNEKPEESSDTSEILRPSILKEGFQRTGEQQALLKRNMHIFHGVEGVHVWIRDSELNEKKLGFVENALRSELHATGVKLAELTLNGKKNARRNNPYTELNFLRKKSDD